MVPKKMESGSAGSAFGASAREVSTIVIAKPCAADARMSNTKQGNDTSRQQKLTMRMASVHAMQVNASSKAARPDSVPCAHDTVTSAEESKSALKSTSGQSRTDDLT